MLTVKQLNFVKEKQKRSKVNCAMEQNPLQFEHIYFQENLSHSAAPNSFLQP